MSNRKILLVIAAFVLAAMLSLLARFLDEKQKRYESEASPGPDSDG